MCFQNTHACAGQNEPRSRHVIEEQCLFRGMDAPPARSSDNLGSLWQSSSRPLHLRKQLSLPNLFTKSTDALAHEWPSLPLYTVALVPQVLRRVREQRHKIILIAPLWRNQPWVSGVIPVVESSPVAYPLETGPPLSSERHDMASTARVMGPAWVAARWEPFVLPERVLNTMAEARAPSTRHL